MEIYLNIIEWDRGVYGAGAASAHYFGVPPAKLTTTQAARLAAVLPSPATRDAGNPGPGTARIARRIAARMAAGQADAACVPQ
jgi:monofunctional biosynthetic peptidoglycan transglycosylase